MKPSYRKLLGIVLALVALTVAFSPVWSDGEESAPLLLKTQVFRP